MLIDLLRIKPDKRSRTMRCFLIAGFIIILPGTAPG
jgi:hypothetical protein